MPVFSTLALAWRKCLPRCGAALLAGGALANASAGAFQALRPGQEPALTEDLTVNVVRIGFRGLLDEAAFARELPPANWLARGREGGGRAVEIAWRYRYNIVDAPRGFEDFLFGVLRAAAFPQPAFPVFPGLPPLPITVDQALYNFCNLDPAIHPGVMCDPRAGLARVNRRFIAQNHVIDASLVEAVLAHNLPALGIDVRQPTVVLMNWWGRPDYIDHVYMHMDDPVPETGVPRGLFLGNALGAWGGTPHDDPQGCARLACVPHRLWFADLSAGPFIRNGTWDLASPLVRTYSSPEGEIDYRLHHIADYLHAGPGTYRRLDTLTSDLAGKLVADVFLGNIATAAASYPTALSPPLLPRDIRVNLQRYRWGDGRNLDALLDPARVAAKLNQLPYRFTTTVTERPDPRASRIGDAAHNLISTRIRPVYGNRVTPLADLYFYWKDHLREFTTGAADYEITLFHFAVDDSVDLLYGGYADGNWATLERFPNANGARMRQAETVLVTLPQEAPFRSHVNVSVHEVGHHLGLHHPFHGSRCLDRDCAGIRLLNGTGGTFYSWHGAHVHGVMTYVNVNDDFSRFERDNVARWVNYQHLRHANLLAARLLASPHAHRVAGPLANADSHAAAALAHVAAMDYEAAAAAARAAYRLLVDAAALIGVSLEPAAEAAEVRTPPDLHMEIRKEFRQMFVQQDPVEWMMGMRGLRLPPGLAYLRSLPEHRMPTAALPAPLDARQFRYVP